MKQLIKNLNTLANSIGFGKVLSYDKIYKTSINTFGRKDASMWFFTISISDKNLICGIEVNRTYFSPTKQTLAINKIASFENQITFEKAFEIINNLK